MSQEPARRVVYQAAFEAMMRASGAESNPELLKAFAAAGYDVAQPRNEYAPDDMQRVLEVATRATFPGVPLDDAYEAFARRAFQAYRRTLVGQVVFAALSMVGIEQALRLAIRGFHSLTNYTRHEVLRTGPEEFTYRLHDTTMPVTYTVGLLKEFFAGTRNPHVQVTIGSISGTQVDLLLREAALSPPSGS